MRKKRFPEDVTGMVEGPDGPVRRTRAHVRGGYLDEVEYRSAHWADACVGNDGINLEDRQADEFLG